MKQDSKFDLLRLGKYRYGYGGRVNSALALGFGHALNAVYIELFDCSLYRTVLYGIRGIIASCPYRSKYFLEKEIRENIVPYSVLELVLFRL